MAKTVIHVLKAEAANDLAALIAQVRAGAEVVIDGREPIVVTVRTQTPPGRLLSESIALAEAHGSTAFFVTNRLFASKSSSMSALVCGAKGR